MIDDQDGELQLLDAPDEALEFKDWLKKRYLRFLVAHNGNTSQRAFAMALGISDANLTNYINGLRRPSGEMVEKLAESRYVGPGIYDKLGMSRKMPKDKLLLFVIDNLPLLPKEEQKEIIEHIRNKVLAQEERARAQRGGPAGSHGPKEVGAG